MSGRHRPHYTLYRLSQVSTGVTTYIMLSQVGTGHTTDRIGLLRYTQVILQIVPITSGRHRTHCTEYRLSQVGRGYLVHK